MQFQERRKLLAMVISDLSQKPKKNSLQKGIQLPDLRMAFPPAIPVFIPLPFLKKLNRYSPHRGGKSQLFGLSNFVVWTAYYDEPGRAILGREGGVDVYSGN